MSSALKEFFIGGTDMAAAPGFVNAGYFNRMKVFSDDAKGRGGLLTSAITGYCRRFQCGAEPLPQVFLEYVLSGYQAVCASAFSDFDYFVSVNVIEDCH